MTTYRTGNPIGSTDPKDLYDNAENTDVFVNSLEREYWDDRFGRNRKTLYGMEQDFQQFLIDSGYVNIGDYIAGLEITERNQIFWKDGELYRAGASLELPYTTTGDWEDEGSLFVAVGDRSIRQELSSDYGSFLIANGFSIIHSIDDLLKVPSDVRDKGSVFFVESFYAGLGKGSGFFVWKQTGDKASANGGTVIDPDNVGVYDGTPTTVDSYLLAQGQGSGTGCWIRLQIDDSVYVESFGASGNKEYLSTLPLRSCFNALKGTGLTARDKGGEHVIDDIISVYSDLVFTGDVILLLDNNKDTRLLVSDIEETPYDLIDPTILSNLDMLSNDIGVPVEYAGRYISIRTSETIRRRNPVNQEYPINYSGKVGGKDGPGATTIFPRLSISYNKSLVTQVRVYKPRDKISVRFSDIVIDATGLSEKFSGHPRIEVTRDNVEFMFNHIRQVEGDFSFPNCLSVISNGVVIKGQTLTHYSYDGGDVYPILLSRACDVEFIGVSVLTNSSSSFSSGNSYNIRLTGVSGVSAGCHFGGHWVIRDSKFSQHIQHGGSDLYVYGSSFTLVTMRGDYCHLAGDFVVEGSEVFRRASASTSCFRLRVDNSPLTGTGSFDYQRTWVFPEIISIKDIQIDSDRVGNIYSLVQITAATLEDTEDVVIIPPKVFDVQNITGQSGNQAPGDAQDRVILFNYYLPKRTATESVKILLNFDNIKISRFNNNTDHTPLTCINTSVYPDGYITQASDIQLSFYGSFKNIHNRHSNSLITWTGHIEEILFENVLNGILGGWQDPVPGLSGSLPINRQRVRFSNVWFNGSDPHLKHGRFEFINCSFEIGFRYDPSGSYAATIDRVIGCAARQSAQTVPPVSKVNYWVNPDLYTQP